MQQHASLERRKLQRRERSGGLRSTSTALPGWSRRASVWASCELHIRSSCTRLSADRAVSKRSLRNMAIVEAASCTHNVRHLHTILEQNTNSRPSDHSVTAVKALPPGMQQNTRAYPTFFTGNVCSSLTTTDGDTATFPGKLNSAMSRRSAHSTVIGNAQLSWQAWESTAVSIPQSDAPGPGTRNMSYHYSCIEW